MDEPRFSSISTDALKGLPKGAVTDTCANMDTSPIKIYRAKKGLTQQEFADLLETSREMVARLEGPVGTVTAEMAVRIEKATLAELKRIDLRPDIFGDLRATASPEGEAA